MNILVLGSGGREHAICWRLSQDESCKQIFVWPGNAGMKLLSFKNEEKLHLLKDEFNQESLKKIISEKKISLVIPGAEKFLYEGVGTWCAEWGTDCLGPDLGGSMLEKSKLFSKGVMRDAGISTASYEDLTQVFADHLPSAESILKKFKKPVIKISGPSLGKGVFVCQSPEEAMGVLKEIQKNPMSGLEEGLFVEEGLRGEEISLFYACNGEDYLYLGAAQDHKRLQDHDRGPNTGGMGAYSPVNWASESFLEKITRDFLVPTLKEMKRRGTPFKGILFLGLMVDGEESSLLEYNVRFGDPETQSILPLVEGDLSLSIKNLLQGKASPIKIKKMSSVHVVKAAKGYPGLFGQSIEKGQKISLDIVPDAHSLVFFAGVKSEGPNLVTDGGRVLGVTSIGSDQKKARELAYKKLQEVSFPGEHFRTDIGARA